MKVKSGDLRVGMLYVDHDPDDGDAESRITDLSYLVDSVSGKKEAVKFALEDGSTGTIFGMETMIEVGWSNDSLWAAQAIAYLAHNPTKSLFDFGVETERDQGQMMRYRTLMEQTALEVYAANE